MSRLWWCQIWRGDEQDEHSKKTKKCSLCRFAVTHVGVNPVTLVDVVWFFWFLEDQNVPVYSLGVWRLTPVDWLFCNKKRTTSCSEFFEPFFGSSFWFWVVHPGRLFGSSLNTEAFVLSLGWRGDPAAWWRLDTEDSSSLGTTKPIESAWRHPIFVYSKRCVSMRFRYTHHITYTCTLYI